MKHWFLNNTAIFSAICGLLREMGLFKQINDFLSI